MRRRSASLPRLLYALLLLGFADSTVQAQELPTCPFGPQDAVQDTVPPQRYYPLAIGNVWVFQSLPDPGDPQRPDFLIERVTGDTLIGGHRYFALQESAYHGRPGSGAVGRVRCCRYLRVTEEGVLTYPDQEEARLGHPLNSCYDDARYGLTAVSKSEGYRPILKDTLKVKDFDHGFFSKSFHEGWGPTGVFGYGGLVYAEVGGDTLRLTEENLSVITSAEEEDVPPQQEIEVWPNPVRTLLHVRVPTPGAGTLEVRDLLGRLLERQDLSAGGEVQMVNMSAYVSGIYIIRALGTGNALHARLVVRID